MIRRNWGWTTIKTEFKTLARIIEVVARVAENHLMAMKGHLGFTFRMRGSPAEPGAALPANRAVHHVPPLPGPMLLGNRTRVQGTPKASRRLRAAMSWPWVNTNGTILG